MATPSFPATLLARGIREERERENPSIHVPRPIDRAKNRGGIIRNFFSTHNKFVTIRECQRVVGVGGRVDSMERRGQPR